MRRTLSDIVLLLALVVFWVAVFAILSGPIASVIMISA
jgi:hypothetical protein